MIRNLKALGLAVMAAFAFSAVAASGAQALTVDAPGAVTITGEQLTLVPPHDDHEFTLSSGRGFTCNNAVFDGTVNDGDTFITVTPTYSGCFSNGTQPTTVTHNGCDYKFYGGTTEPDSTHAFHKVTVDLECPKDKDIEVHVYSSHANHTAGTVLCTYTIKPFVGTHENTLENTTGTIKDLDLTTTVSNIPVTRVTGSALVCGNENQTAVYTGATTVRAYSNTAHTIQVPLTITD